MVNNGKIVSLEKQIRKVVTYRIVICLLLLLITVFFFTIYDFYNSFTLLQRNIKSQCDTIKGFVVSQMLINNESAIQAKLDQITQEQNSIHFTWVETTNNLTSEKMNWTFPLGWNYYYPISSSDDIALGYLKVYGSFFVDKVLFYQLLTRMTLLLIFSVSMFLLLYPLATRIPQFLFIKPINELLKLIKIGEKGESQNDRINFPLEINEISKKIKSLFNEVEQKTRDAAFSQLATQVAHDIRSPLTTLDLAIKDITNIPEEERILIRNAANHIHDVANNLLTQYKKNDAADSGTAISKSSPELIATLIQSILSEKRAQYKNKPVEFLSDIHQSAYGVFATVCASEFKRVLSNLLNNAVEATTKERNMITRVILTAENNHLTIRIQDNGCGIPSELLPKIISDKISTKNENGYGLGLSHAIKTVEDTWGGQFSIQSHMGDGTTIDITLPKAQTPAWFASKLSVSSQQIIVVLDDDQSIHQIWRKRFEKNQENILFSHFQDPDEFIAWHKNQLSDKYIFLMDYELINHSVTGLDVIEQLNIAHRSYLVTSRDEDFIVRERCKKLGVKIIPKSFAPYVSICIIPEKADLIILDDCQALTDAWVLHGGKKGKCVAAFNRIADLRAVLGNYEKNTPIYIDSNLNDVLSGQDFSKELYANGFTRLYLATAYPVTDFNEMPWITAILGKEPPF